MISAAAKDCILHECTSLFFRGLFPSLLPAYNWHWPSRISPAEAAPDGDGEPMDAEDPDCVLDLSPCQFGWPASRGRSYTVSWF